MTIHPLPPRRQRLSVLVTRTALVALLTPVILAAGLIAAALMPAAILSRHLSARIVGRREPGRAAVLQLETSPVESSVGL
ncbi:MAG TPA: hypothetical protein VG388_14815 [Solirubrobacteraceae bacterium]|nr:hypothetical protein [Solirubrobacteraceae bacterium]